MKKVRLGVAGLGNMGTGHLKYLCTMDTVEIAGVCDIVKEKADRLAAQYGAPAYTSHVEMLEKAALDAILIAVPHYDHVPIAVDSFAKGVHVLCEKPITVHVAGAKKMLDAYEAACRQNPGLLFGLMFQERTLPYYKKIKDVVASGELGRLTRVTWINTAWFRSQAYYDSGGWRATWAGEGGGILTNQCPHNLDMYHWLFGMPARVNGFAHIGKYHNIEVEDEVTAYMEHENGMVGHFIVTTGECPGTNRLEIVGENGTLVCEHGRLVFHRNRQSMLAFSRETRESFAKLENWETHIPVDEDQPKGHRVVTERFVNAILSGGGELVASGEEGLNPVMLANGIMLSSFEERTVRFPLEGGAFEARLEALIAGSTFRKTVDEAVKTDFSQSFNH